MLNLIFELIPEEGVIDRYYSAYPYIFRGIFMDWLREIAPRFIHDLHEYEKIRPYSINRIIDLNRIRFILTIFHENISESIMESILRGEKDQFNIGGKKFILSTIKFEKITLKQIIDDSRSVQMFNIRFITPVYFNTSKGDYQVRFPLPILLFGNLANIWNFIASGEAEINRKPFLEWVKMYVYFSSFKIETKESTIGKMKPVVGGLGKITYTVQDNNANYCCWLEILCRLGEYTNVGGNRTAGMGVMRYQPKKYF